MLFVCVGHFSYVYFAQTSPQVEELLHLGLGVGRVGAPCFMVLSGILLGFLWQKNKGAFQQTQAKLIDRAFFLLIIAHPIIALMHTAEQSVLAALGHLYFTDLVAFCVVMGSMLVPKISVGMRLLLLLAVNFLSTAASLKWEPNSVPLLIFRDSIFGSYQVGLHYSHLPYLPWFSLYLFGTCVGEVIAGSHFGRKSGRTFHILIGCSITALALAMLMRIIYKLLTEDQILFDGDLRYYALFASPFQKLPPGPFFVLFNVGLGMGMLSLICLLDRTVRISKLLALLSLLGRNSLLVFVVQEGVYFLLLNRFVRFSSPSAISFWPLYFIASLALIVAAAILLDRARLSGYMTVGYPRLLHLMREELMPLFYGVKHPAKPHS